MSPAKCLCVKNHSPEPQRLNVHHIHPQALGGSNAKSNLITICPNTHNNVHELLDYMFDHDGEMPNGGKGFNRLAKKLARQGYDSVKAGTSDVD
jgi:5-methylcytosine-specific restriction endonuclease McrA